MADREKVIKQEIKYTGPIFEIEVATVELANGELATRDIVRHVPAISVLAFADDNHVYLEKQWRTTVGDFVLEIPAGKLDERDFNQPDHAVNRELNEELRMHAGKIIPASGFYETVGMSDVFMHLYLAYDLKALPESKQLARDRGESLDIIKTSFEDMQKMFENGQLNDQKTVTAFLYWAYLRNSEKNHD